MVAPRPFRLTMSSDPRAQIELVFLLGISHRSGTNYLASLLEQHPEIGPGPLPEDFLVAKLGVLSEYLDRVREEWSRRWDVNAGRRALASALAGGLEAFLCREAPPGVTRVLSRTPSVDGLEYLRRFFPDAFVILLVRDGRAVVESGMRSFAWHFDDASRRWARGATAISAFRSSDPAPERTLLVQYEDLVREPKGQVAEILNFLGLDPDRLPADAGQRTGIIGSSQLRTAGGELHWKPENIQNFDPLSRFADWSDAKHRRFDWLAGPALEVLGYGRSGRDGGLLNRMRQRALSLFSAARPLEVRRAIRHLVRSKTRGC